MSKSVSDDFFRRLVARPSHVIRYKMAQTADCHYATITVDSTTLDITVKGNSQSEVAEFVVGCK